nr:EFR1 family ferrodoxin [Maliibacterium massiliense]
MVLYFSGTGNSQFVVSQIAKLLQDDDVISINRYLKAGGETTLASKRPLLFVAPTYCWRLPRVVVRWIMRTTFKGSQSAYFILTCGGSCGNAAHYARRLCAKKNLRFCGLAPIVMPENYQALFSTPSQAQCQAIIQHAAPRIAAVAEQIRAGARLDTPPVSMLGKLQSGPVNPLFYALFVHDRGFRVSESCVSCGKCARRCPMNNIDLPKGRPIWKGNCTHCMACIAGCPTGAIAYKDRSAGRHRHYMMDDALCWEVETRSDAE